MLQVGAGNLHIRASTKNQSLVGVAGAFVALVDNSCNVGGLLLSGVWVEGDDELRRCGVGEELGFELCGLPVGRDFGENRTDP